MDRTKIFVNFTLLICLLTMSPSTTAQQWRTAYYFQPASSALPVSDAPFSKYTHVTQANILASYDAQSDACGLNTMAYGISDHAAEFVRTVQQAGAKALVTLLGDTTRAPIMKICTDNRHINQFVAALATFINDNGYDGFDLDWEAGIVGNQWRNLVTTLRTALPGKLVTAAVTVTERFMASAVQDSLDQINIMNYDRDSGLYDGTPAADTWYSSALYAGGDTSHPSAEMDVRYFTQAGVSGNKLGIGIPFYARIKQRCMAGYLNGSTCTQAVSAPLQRFATGNASDNLTKSINYNDLLLSPFWSDGNKVWDAAHGAEYIQYTAGGVGQTAFVPYTGVEQVQAAAYFVKNTHLGGIMTYELSGEFVRSAVGDARYPLSTVLFNAINTLLENR